MFARMFAIALATAFAAGCGGSPATLTMTITSASPSFLGVTVRNQGDASTAPLTLSLFANGIFSIGDSDDCSGRALGSQESCFVKLDSPVSTDDQPQGMLTVDDGHGVRATMTLTAIKAVVQLRLDGYNNYVDVREGNSASALLSVTNSGQVKSGPLVVDVPAANLADDPCSGVTLPVDVFCQFSIQYTAPIGLRDPVTVSGSVHADPGGSVPFAVHFNVLGLLSAIGPSFGSQEPSGARATFQIDDNGATPVGPLQLSIDSPSGDPTVPYPPFVLVEDNCSGQTLMSTSECTGTIALDARLPGGRSYGATLVVGAGAETLRVPLAAGRSLP
jgi:hypothetical protein